jgi:hypothetical protein
VGHIAHIYASSDNGPRGNLSLTNKQRNSPENLILLCGHHHPIVDTQHETYPASMLLEWKEAQERPAREELATKMKDVGYAELEFAANALLSMTPTEPGAPVTIPPEEKMAKNGLGPESAFYIKLGAAKSEEVAQLIIKAAQLDGKFPHRLRSGFVLKYLEFKQRLEGDDLFEAMHDWASGDHGANRARQLAGLCMLCHLFIVCDVFEKSGPGQ